MELWLKVLIGGIMGLVAGGVLGHFGKCSSGACPLTANPFRGAIVGAFIGVLIVLAWSERRPAENTKDNVPHIATVAEFDEKVLKSPRPVLVDFYSEGCSPCRRLAPTISKLKDEYEGKANVFKVNVREVAELVNRYGIGGVPTVMLFNKDEILKWIGPKDESTYRKAIEEALSKQERNTQ